MTPNTEIPPAISLEQEVITLRRWLVAFLATRPGKEITVSREHLEWVDSEIANLSLSIAINPISGSRTLQLVRKQPVQ